MTAVPETYTLRDPITVRFTGPGGEREEVTSEVTIRPPKGKDMRVIDRHPGQVAQSLAMIAQLTGLPIAQVDELSAIDIAGMSEVIERFTVPGLPTGATSSAS